MTSTLTRAVLDELEALRNRVALLEAANEELRAKVDGLEVVLAPGVRPAPPPAASRADAPQSRQLEQPDGGEHLRPDRERGRAAPR